MKYRGTYDELKTLHEVDQAVAESIALGNMRIIGVSAKGEPLLRLTAKGVCRVSCMLAAEHIRKADEESRDFLPGERQEVMMHLAKAIQALKKD